MIDKTGRKCLISYDGEFSEPFDIDNLGTEPCPLDNIGSAAYIEGSSTQGTIMFFDERGVNLAYFSTSNGKWGQKQSVAAWGGGEFPFNLKGISAAMNYGVEEDPFLPGYYTNIRAFFEADSERYCLFHNKSSSDFDAPRHMDNFVLNKDYPLEGVGAAVGIKLGQQRYYLLFNDAGDRYVIVVNDWIDYYAGPYRI